MTTGAAWKSADAGPNRILRWVMRLSDDQLLEFGIFMKKLKPHVQAKLREKAATYEDCMDAGRKLAWLAYQMPDAPEPPSEIREYLETFFGPMEQTTCCMICREPLSFTLFEKAQRGKAEIETSHAVARRHDPENVGFAHRACNIAQGPLDLDEFYDWMESVLARVRAQKPQDHTA